MDSQDVEFNQTQRRREKPYYYQYAFLRVSVYVRAFARAGYASAVDYDFLRVHQNEYLDFLFVVSVIARTCTVYCFTN